MDPYTASGLTHQVIKDINMFVTFSQNRSNKTEECCKNIFSKYNWSAKDVIKAKINNITSIVKALHTNTSKRDNFCFKEAAYFIANLALVLLAIVGISFAAVTFAGEVGAAFSLIPIMASFFGITCLFAHLIDKEKNSIKTTGNALRQELDKEIADLKKLIISHEQENKPQDQIKEVPAEEPKVAQYPQEGELNAEPKIEKVPVEEPLFIEVEAKLEIYT